MKANPEKWRLLVSQKTSTTVTPDNLKIYINGVKTDSSLEQKPFKYNYWRSTYIQKSYMQHVEKSQSIA